MGIVRGRLVLGGERGIYSRCVDYLLIAKINLKAYR